MPKKKKTIEGEQNNHFQIYGASVSFPNLRGRASGFPVLWKVQASSLSAGEAEAHAALPFVQGPGWRGPERGYQWDCHTETATMYSSSAPSEPDPEVSPERPAVLGDFSNSLPRRSYPGDRMLQSNPDESLRNLHAHSCICKMQCKQASSSSICNSPGLGHAEAIRSWTLAPGFPPGRQGPGFQSDHMLPPGASAGSWRRSRVRTPSAALL